MSRRRNAGRPRGWRAQQRAGAPVKQTPGDLELLQAPVLDGSDRELELLAWGAYKAFLEGDIGKATRGERYVRLIRMHEDVLWKIPTSVVTHWNLGDLYWFGARLEDAMREYETTLQLAPRMGAAHTRVAYCLLGLGEVERAKERLERACQAPSVTMNSDIYLAEAHLLLGHYHEGWRRQDLVARHAKTRLTKVFTRHMRGPLWEGQPLEGPLVIGGCDGNGDNIQCARYVPLARDRVGALTLLVSDPLVPLFRGQFEGVTVRGFGVPPDPRQFAAWLPLMCLPSALGIQSAADIPGTPYLHATEPFPQLGGKFKVGIRWAGQPGNAHDLMRSTHLSQWAPLLAIQEATFFSFQFEAAAAELAEPIGAQIADVAQALGHWGTTAAALSQMDLVIAVDSSLAHLAGAMGLPVWIPLMAAVEWRWGLESPTTPWYPSARLFRQRRVHEWGPVFAAMAAALREEVERRRMVAA
jgi:hypothetical protein